MLGTEEGYEFFVFSLSFIPSLVLLICLSYGNSDVAIGDYRLVY